MQPVEILDLFDDLVTEVVAALSDLEDWGLSGKRATQYNHDVVADEIIVGALVEEGFGVLSEESGLVGAAGGRPTVVVDPVDGSTNGARALPWYASSLCAVDDDGPLVSLVANLATGDRFRAVRGQGAQSDEVTLSPSDCNSLSEAIVAFSGLPPSHGGWRQYRTYGAAALDLCAVASGTFDAYVDVDGAHGVWDYLGAYLVCQEMGVRVVDGERRDMVVLDPTVRRGPVAARSGALLDELLAMRSGWQA